MILIPLFKFGGGNDFVMRGSAALLFIFFVYMAKFLFESPNKVRKALLLLLFLIGVFTPALEISRSVANYSVKIPPLEKQFSVMDLYKYRSNNQYLGDKNAFFWKYLAKHPQVY